MKRLTKKLLAIIIVIVMMSGMIPLYSGALDQSIDISVNPVTDIQKEIKTVADANGGTVTVIGSATATAALTLNIPAAVTVKWEATYSGDVKGAYLLNLTGAGPFILDKNGSISNTGTGGTINASGAGMSITLGSVDGAGRILCPQNGITLNVAANNVAVNINSNGTVDNTGPNSAINVTAGVTGVRVNVNGGKVSSLPAGYAINDGGTSTCENNTQISITSGSLVEASSACAIRSTGVSSVVNVMDSTVTNAASTNSNPTIYMNGDPTKSYDNIIIGGSSLVYTSHTSNTSYVIQTTGNVIINNDAQIKALEGRAINLVGNESKAIINGGTVSSVSNVAISTATTAGVDVTNASVVINGGLVSSQSGNTIQLTGANSEVTVNGGHVKSSASGNAIYVTGAGTNAKVNINGGWVSATNGRAIYITATAANAAVKVDSGFVFAWGRTENDVINKAPVYSGNGVVAAWNTTTGKGTYVEGASNDLQKLPSTVPSLKAFWHTNGVANGVYYANGSNTGFFPLDVEITVNANEFGLIFDVETGYFYLDTGVVPITDNPKFDEEGTMWEWDELNGVLELKDFFWATSAPVALTIINSGSGSKNIHIKLTGMSLFSTTNTAQVSVGIKSEGTVDISGQGSLSAASAGGCGIDTGVFSISDGTVTASGGTSAYLDGMTVNPPGPRPAGYSYRTSTIQSGAGASQRFSYITPYSYDAQNKYVEIKTIHAHALTINDGTGITTGYCFAGERIDIEAHIPQSFVPPPFDPYRVSPIKLGVIPVTWAPPYAYPLSIPVFKSWTGSDGVFENPGKEKTSFTMPDNDAQIVAESQLAYKLWVSGAGNIAPYSSGTRLGYFLPDDEIPLITISSYPDGWFFDGWSVVDKVDAPGTGTPGSPTKDRPGQWEFSDPFSVFTTFIMPESNAIVLGTWANRGLSGSPAFTLRINNGGGHLGAAGEFVNALGPMQSGTWVRIKADDPPAGEEFDRWIIEVPASTGYRGAFINAYSPSTQFIMGEGNITIKATYKPLRYTLVVVSGVDEDDAGLLRSLYAEGETAHIKADPPPDGQVFDRWVSSDYDQQFGNARAAETTFLMPDNDVIITATYRDLPTGTEEPDPPAEPPPPPPPPPRPGTGDGDVSHILNTEHHNQYVRGVASNKRTTGVEFQPNRDMTRAEVAQMFYNLLLEQNVPITKRFPDEPLTAWHEKAVHTMASLGIIQGYTDGSFRPEGSVTRAEFVVMAARFAKTLPQAEHLAFHDVAETHWAYEHINAAVQFGWITGYSDGSFQPSRHISRAEAVTIVNRMLGRVADKEYIDSHSSIARFVDIPQTHWAFYDIMEAYNTHDYDIRATGEHWVD